MEEKIVKIATVIMCGMAVIVVSALLYFPDLHIKAEEAAELRVQQEEARSAAMSGLEILNYNTDNAKEEEKIAFAQQLRLQMPEGIDSKSVTITNDYVTQTVRIQIPNADENYIYDCPMIGKSSHIDNLTYEDEKEEGIIEITLDSIFELDTTYEGQYLYLDFLTPHELYDKVVVIDAGHGGHAPGATKQNICEKDIDLAIVMQLKELFDNDGDESIGVYYTRTDDSNPSFEQRVELANKADADLFVSIHNNATKSGRMSSINGTAVMYDEEKAAEEKGSMQFADICLQEMLASLGSNSKGIVTGHDIFIIRSAQMPVALIEVGFMTNQEELNHLNDAEYQKKAAQGVYNALHRALEEGF